MSDPSEYLSPTILDSRRLFGPNVFGSSAGAVLDVRCDTDALRAAASAWPHAVQQLAATLSWEPVSTQRHDAVDQTSLFLTAPLDGLLTATDLSEHAWVMAEAGVVQPGEQSVSQLRETYATESARTKFAPRAASLAQQWQCNFSLDDESCAIGGGAGVFVHRFDTSPDESADALPNRASVVDVPTVLVTGSNGKTTTTRLVAAMWRAAGRRAGWCCSDGVYIDGEQIEFGDYTGPGGARAVLDDVRVEAAVLETARGGMLRRGLALSRADGAIVTNISDDHLGEYGVASLRDLAHAKRIVARAIRPAGALVLNADDPTLRDLGDDIASSLTQDGIALAWFSATDQLRRAPEARELATVVREEVLLLHSDGAWHAIGDVREMPLTLRGGARHNVANIAGAALLARVAGVPLDAIRGALSTFGADASDNPGRLMLREFGGVTVVMDYAHNPDGIASLCRTAAAMPGTRRLLLLGQAGNRDDAQMRALAASAWRTQTFDRVLLKEMTAMLRGRAPGEIPQMLRAALMDAGAPAHALEIVPSEIDGVRAALAWARAGDVLVLGVHVERARVLALMNALGASSWKPGAPLPAD